jgi:hypothetical protein
MKGNRYLALVLALALTACKDNVPATVEGNNSPPTQASASVSQGTADDTSGHLQLSSEQVEATAALMNVAKLLATEHGGDPVAVAQFCEQNAQEFANVEDLQQCKALAQSRVAKVPVPRTREEMFQIAATIPAIERFDYCTSDQVTKFYQVYGDDYNRCYPDAVKDEAERLHGQRNDENWVPAQVSPEAIREQIIANSAKMSPRERKAYCYIPSVLAEFENDPGQCLNGMLIPTDDDPGYRDEGH